MTCRLSAVKTVHRYETLVYLTWKSSRTSSELISSRDRGSLSAAAFLHLSSTSLRDQALCAEERKGDITAEQSSEEIFLLYL